MNPPSYGTSSTYLTVDAARSLLNHVITPATAPHVITRLFAGLRKAEANAFSWGDMVFDGDHQRIAEVHVDELRTFHQHHCRLVPACPALQEWLRPFAGLTGSITRNSKTSRFVHEESLKCGVTLGHSVLRTSYAAYRLAQTRDVGLVAQEIGSSNNWFFRPIQWPSSVENAQLFFGLTPGACGRPEWAQEVAAWRQDGHKHAS